MAVNIIQNWMKNILVTGATGFIGTCLLPLLHQQEWQITATLRKDVQQNLPIPLKTITVGEIDKQTQWQQALEGIDTVIHLAARAHILDDRALDPEAEFMRVNYQGTVNLVKQSIQAGVKHFIFMSSIGAITTLSQDILTEDSPCQPDTPYGRSKLKAEQAIRELTQNTPMTWTIIRPTLVYGPGNPGNMGRLIKLINTGLPLPLGGINNRRSFVYVGNLVDAIATCITHPGAINQTFLISDGEDLSTPQLIRYLAKALGKPAPRSGSLRDRVFYFPPNLLELIGKIAGKSDIIDRLTGSLAVNSHKIQTALDWKPPFSLEEGLKATAERLTG